MNNPIRTKDGSWRITPFFSWIEWLAERRNEGKEEYDSARYYSANPHLTGLVGELVFSLESGLGLDTTISPGGDEGFDFKAEDGSTVDVKTSTYFDDPLLILPARKVLESDYLCLCAFDTENLLGRYCGWMPTEEAARIRPRQLGNRGKRRVIKRTSLREGLPPGYELAN